jgi:hypothetical protein
VSKRISSWLEPDSYFVSFPQSVFSYNILREHRTSDISSKHRFFVSWKGETVRNGLFLPFTFRHYDIKKFRAAFSILSKGSCEWKSDEDGIEINRIERKEANTGKWIKLEQVFRLVPLGKKSVVVESPWYYEINMWEGYCKYLASEERRYIKRPRGALLSDGWRRIVRDLGKEDDIGQK